MTPYQQYIVDCKFYAENFVAPRDVPAPEPEKPDIQEFILIALSDIAESLDSIARGL